MPDEADERRAEFVYEAARLHARILGCPVVPAPWDEREEDFRRQFVDLIAGMCRGKVLFESAEKAHDSWVKKHLEMGWKHGETYDPEHRTHPDLVPYDELDPKEKVKDDVFLRLVGLARDYIW